MTSYIPLTDPQVILACQQGRGPTVQFLLERDRVGALINGMSNDPAVQQPLPDPPAQTIIDFYAPFKDTTRDAATINSLVWQAMAKYFSFQLEMWSSTSAVNLLVATKTLATYINAGVVYPDPYVARSQLDNVFASVACNEDNGTQTLVSALINPTNNAQPAAVVYDRLEGATYPGVAQNIDLTKYIAALQQLMQACGWSLDSYNANTWTQSHNVMALFQTQLLALTQGQPSTPQAYTIDNAYNAFVRDYQAASQGSFGVNPVYAEGWNGGNLEWYFYSPTYNNLGPTFFFGRVGTPTVYAARKAPTAVITPSPSLYDVMNNSAYDFTGARLQCMPAVFEAVSMGQFFDALSTQRAAFLTNNTNYFATLT